MQNVVTVTCFLRDIEAKSLCDQVFPSEWLDQHG